MGGLHEIVKHNETGIIAEACEPGLIAQALKDYFSAGQPENSGAISGNWKKNFRGEVSPKISILQLRFVNTLFESGYAGKYPAYWGE